MTKITSKTYRTDNGWVRYFSRDGIALARASFRYTNNAGPFEGYRGASATMGVYSGEASGNAYETPCWSVTRNVNGRARADSWARAELAKFVADGGLARIADELGAKCQ